MLELADDEFAAAAASGPRQKGRILREIKLLRHFGSHENIVQVKDIITVPPNTIDFSDVYIVTNLMERARRVLCETPGSPETPAARPRSDLDRIITSRQTLTNQHHQYFLYQILRGQVHPQRPLHRDLAAEFARQQQLRPRHLRLRARAGLRRRRGQAHGVRRHALVPRAGAALRDGDYDEAIDAWSVGCIFAEMLRRKPFFRGDTPQHQLETIVSVLGKPGDGALEKIQHEAAASHLRARVRALPLRPYFPRHVADGARPAREDARLRPAARATVDAALEHPYLSELHGQMPEPLCDDTFDFEFERAATASSDEGKDALPKEEIQSMMFEEMVQLQLVMEDGGADAGAKAGAEGKDGEDYGGATTDTDAVGAATRGAPPLTTIDARVRGAA
ncbi:MAP kinase [Aureococcus anophagefferens]|nr:MAP kinase [Aureococcus anophagefferens]